MLEAMRSDDVIQKVGGKFQLTALIQRRLAQLMEGARPLVPRGNLTPMELVIEEIIQDKIVLEEVVDPDGDSDGTATL